MNVVEQFNALNGKVATRLQLEKLADLCIKEEQDHIFHRIQDVLIHNENDLFRIDINEKAFEIVPESMLNGLNFDETDYNDGSGLNKAVSPNEIYQKVTDLIINTITEVGHLPWQKEWKGTGLPTARNYVSEQPYTGINAITLPYDEKQVNGKTVIIEPKTKDVYYLTFNQIEKLGARLKKGSRGRMVTYFNFVYTYDDKIKGIKFTTSSASDLGNFVKSKKLSKQDLQANLLQYPVLKYYNVFKAEDCENLPKKEPKKINAKPNEIAEKIIELYPNSPKIIIGKDERAFYRPSEDTVYMPNVKAFSEENFYYSTFFHELIHSTGHYSRLERNMTGSKGDSDYAFEELIAELGAVYLCAESGILFHTIENSAKYLRGWNTKLVGKLKEDNKFFFKAAASAQKGANYILNFNSKGEPAYYKGLEKSTKETTPRQVKKIGSKPSKKEVVPNSKYKVGSIVTWENQTVKISKAVMIGNDWKFELNLSKNKTIWTDENTLDSEAKKPVKAIKKEVVKPIEQPAKIDKKGQISLFGVKKVTPKAAPKKNAKIQKIGLAGNDQDCEFFTVAGEVGKFLQRVERKPVHSVVITMDGEQGAGKTTTLYKFMEAFASVGNKSLFLSLEEHPDSSLAIEKRDEYLSFEAQENIDAVAEVENVNELYELIEDYEIIFLDSWQKLQRMVGKIRLDEDLRKKFNGKVFVIIFQQTTTGKTKGGAEVVFDGDIITKMVKESSFSENYAYFDKNRYTLIPIENIRYNIASGKTYNPNDKHLETENLNLETVSSHTFSFNVN